jgi:uncharacterized membrane protein required for colicin V production
MGTIAGFGWFDVAIFAGLVVGLIVGYGQGLVRQIVGLAVLYIGTILGAQYFSLVADFIQYVFKSASVRLVNAVGFFLILAAVTAAISWLVFDAYHVRRLKSFPRLDHVGGSVLGLFTAVIIISVLLPVLAFGTGETWLWGESTRFLVVDGMRTSRLIPLFDLLKPGLLHLLGPWMPGGLPAIFNL